MTSSKNNHPSLGGRQPTLAIDFDGTITEAAEFPKIGKLREGIGQFLEQMKINGWKIIIFTCRTHKYQDAMVRWLDWNMLAYDGVNYNVDCPEAYQKLMADVYLDDRGMTFDPKDDISKLPEKIEEFLKTLPVHIYKPTTE